MQEFNHKFETTWKGEALYVNAENNIDEITVHLRMRKYAPSSAREFIEIGVILYDDDFIDQSSEIPAIQQT